jgi:hypothetical protein
VTAATYLNETILSFLGKLKINSKNAMTLIFSFPNFSNFIIIKADKNKIKYK